MDVINIKNARKRFKQHQVLNDVSLACSKGECVGVVGRNGCGKTVLFKCLCGFYCLDNGEIFINGIKKDNGAILKNTGIIIEHPAYYENYSGKKNLRLLYELNHKRDDEYIEYVMKQVGLNPQLRDKVKKYSMGMRQRLAIAQAIMDRPEILILDEPMNGLDSRGVLDIRELLKDLKNQGTTILLASHNKEDISILCDKVYEMNAGKII